MFDSNSLFSILDDKISFKSVFVLVIQNSVIGRRNNRVVVETGGGNSIEEEWNTEEKYGKNNALFIEHLLSERLIVFGF